MDSDSKDSIDQLADNIPSTSTANRSQQQMVSGSSTLTTVTTVKDNDKTGTAGKTIASVQPLISTKEPSPGEHLSNSLSLLQDTLPGFITGDTPSPSDDSRQQEEGVALDSENVRVLVIKEMPSLEVEGGEESSDSDIDEDALSIIIAVEGEEEEEEGEEREEVAMEVEREHTANNPSERTVSLSDISQNKETVTRKEQVIVLSPEKTVISKAGPDATQTATPTSDKDGTKAQHSKQSAKVKQFFTTLQMYGNKTSQEMADQVQELIAALVNDLVTVEEFHQEIQKVTNHPMKEFVVRFLKENLTYFRDELKSTSLALSDILDTTTNKSNAPAVAPEIAEPDLIVIHSTKPSAMVTTSIIMTTPTSPLRAPANLTSMSVPPATIHEPQLVSPTKIESVINASAINNRKRPRELIVTNGSDDREIAISQRVSKRSRPIPTATLTPETLPTTPSQTHHTPSHTYHTPLSSHTHHAHSSQMHYSPSSQMHYAHSSSQQTHHAPSTSQYYKSTPSSPVATPITEIPTGVAMVSLSSNQHLALINQVKEDWSHLETMLVSVEGMVVKTQKALSLLKDRIQQIGLGPSPAQLKAYEVEIELRLQQKMEKAIEEIQLQASEEKQRILLDATKQMRDTLKDMNTQSNSKESCWNCGRKATETCSGCNKARYCGSYCQHKDWDRHMKQCAGARQSSTVRVETERTPVQIATAIPHNHASNKQPTHYITGPHLPPHPQQGGPSYMRTTSSRTPTPTSYPANPEMYVPFQHADIPSNGSNTLTATSAGVAVVTINRTQADLAAQGVNML